MTPRERAENWLMGVGDHPHPEHAQAAALTGIGWAVLDLADALRARGPEPISFVCQNQGPPEATSLCVRVNGHDDEHRDDTGGTWPL
jgi:hypothetical protein